MGKGDVDQVALCSGQRHSPARPAEQCGLVTKIISGAVNRNEEGDVGAAALEGRMQGRSDKREGGK